MKLKMLLILSVIGFSAQSYSMDNNKSWFAKNKSEIIEYSKSMALGAGIYYLKDQSSSSASSLAAILSLIGTFDILNSNYDKTLNKFAALLLGGFVCQKVMLKIN